MNLDNEQIRKNEASGVPPATCTAASIDDRPSGIAKRFSLPAVAHATQESNPEAEAAVVALLELENRGLRRLVVELLHKNQQLRDQIDLTQETLKASQAR